MSEGRQWITSFDPATGLHIGSFLADNEAEIEGKIERVRLAQRTWKKTTFQQRRRVVRSLLKWLVDNQEVCARVACRDTGKTCQFHSHPEFMNFHHNVSDRRRNGRDLDDLFKDGMVDETRRKRFT